MKLLLIPTLAVTLSVPELIAPFRIPVPAACNTFAELRARCDAREWWKITVHGRAYYLAITQYPILAGATCDLVRIWDDSKDNRPLRLRWSTEFGGVRDISLQHDQEVNEISFWGKLSRGEPVKVACVSLHSFGNPLSSDDKVSCEKLE
jgi:hypothetical protein